MKKSHYNCGYQEQNEFPSQLPPWKPNSQYLRMRSDELLRSDSYGYSNL